MSAVPSQQPGVAARAGLTEEQVRQAAWAVEPGGRLHRGPGAIHAALAWALGRPVILRLYYLPLIRALEDAVYRWIAAHRQWFPGATPYCREHPEECDR